MATTCSDVVNRAVFHSVANAATTLTSNTTEMIAKIAAFEQDVYTKVARENRFFWDTFDATSNDDASGRFFDTATAGNVERLVRVTFTGTDTVVRPVDVEYAAAELAPRYYVLGSMIWEVGSDWGATGTVGLTIGYASAPALLDPSGSILQTISLPDKYADLLSIKLAAYLAAKDMESRDPMEVQNLESAYSDRLASVIASLDQFGGIVNRAFISPYGWPVASD